MILIKLQLIIGKFVLAAADPHNVDIDFATGRIDHNLEPDLASGIELMSCFTEDIKRAFLTGELSGFGEVPPLYMTLHPVVNRKQQPTQEHILNRHKDAQKDPGAG